MANITILAPHIDDEVIGAGGSIAKHINLGNTINIIYVNSGKTPEEVSVRENEAEKVCQFLGVSDYSFLRENPSNLDDESTKKLVALLRQYETDFLYAPHKADGDLEHTKVHELALRCQWIANGENEHYSDLPGKCNIKGVFLYEIHRPIGEVHYLEDISGYEEIKREAIKMYASQISQARYDLSSLGLNTYRGISFELGDSAEAFQLYGFRNIFDSFWEVKK